VKACFVAALAATVSLVGAIATLRAQDTKESLLRVCLDEELPPFSVRTKDGGSGFDFAIAQSLAKRLNRTCPSSDNLRPIRRFEKGGSGSSGVRV
jgi:ABC-type amino acid transport substrate-binding protein